MESNHQTAVADKLQVLRQRFQERLQSDLEALRAFALSAAAGELTPEQALACYRQLHRLAGSAGTFGMPTIGEAAKSVEKRFKPLVEDDAEQHWAERYGAADSPALAEALDALIALAESAPVEQVDGTSDTGKPAPKPQGQGTRIDVMLVYTHATRRALLDLEPELANHGFICRLVRLDTLGEADFSQPGRDTYRVQICHESDLDSLLKRRAGHSGPSSSMRVPVLCVSGTLTFERMYEIAAQGVVGLFSEPLVLPELTERIEALAAERSGRSRWRVVVVDDDEELGEHYSLVLGEAGIETRLVTDPRYLLSELSAFNPDLVLMDVQLGSRSGIHLARMIRYESRWLGLPIIYLSAEDNPDDQLDALSRGADEFLMKPVTDRYLVRAVRIRCQRARQLSDLMNKDSLTGLLKHSLIKQEVSRELARCRRDGRPSCVVMLDIDHFKAVNDTWGHSQGDVVIRALANMLRLRLRESDRVGRYGGEEFLLVLPHCDEQSAAQLVDSIRLGFSDIDFGTGGQRFRVTCSAGVAMINRFDHAEGAITAADQALYARKQSGRNGVTIYQEPGPALDAV